MVRRTLICLFMLTVLLALGAAPAPAATSSARSVDQRIAVLENALKALQGKVTTLKSKVNDQAAQIAALKANPALTLSWLPSYLRLDPDAINGIKGPNIVFSGANLHVVSGSGATDDNGTLTGLGNVIIGYAELPASGVAARTGSHSLMLGRANDFSSFAGLVAGERNSVAAGSCTVTGGVDNTASGESASVSGGSGNTSSGNWTVVSGGLDNIADGYGTSVSGGHDNTAIGYMTSSVSGGFGNTADGWGSSVSGGSGNLARGYSASVSGGGDNTAIGDSHDQNGNSVTGGYNNIARGDYSCVSGGGNNTARGYYASITGGNSNSTAAYSGADGPVGYATVGGGFGITLTTKYGWAAGVPSDPNDPSASLVAPFNQAWFLSPLVTATQ